jgi:GNAT superfamily N-acetyltransferase
MTVVIGGGVQAETITAFAACDMDELVEMYERCSPATRYARWHGHTKRFPPGYLQRLLHDDAALVTRRDGALVALGSAARAGAAVWEIGLLVEDAWQHRGVGRRLLLALVERVQSLGARGLRAELLEQDAALLHPLRTLGPVLARSSFGVITAEVTLWA